MSGLTDDQRNQYDDKGYVLLEGLFQPQELKGLIDEIDDSVDQIANSFYANESIRSKYEDHGFDTRLLKIIEDSPDAYRELVGSVLMGPELFKILSHSKLIDIVEGIVGPEVHCEGRHRLRPKLPNYGVADFRWHEDTPYAAKRITYVQQQYGLGDEDPRAGGKFMSRIVAAPQMPEPNFWIPLVPVNEENGCLHVLPGGHKHTPPYENQWEPNKFLPELDYLEPVVIPMKVGDALLMHQHVPHVSPPNQSNGVRWSVDIRYQDGTRPVKSIREPGFLARSQERPQDVVTDHQGYQQIRNTVAEFREKSGIRY